MRRMTWGIAAVAMAGGCAPTAPTLLERPEGFAETWHAHRLYHTPNAYIYARSETAAGEADAWVQEVGVYLQKKYKRSLGKGLVLVMDPEDAPLARTLDEALAFERDPAVMITQPKRLKSAEEMRKRYEKEGQSERAMARGVSLPLSSQKVEALGLKTPPMPWAVAASSKELARDCGRETGVSVLRKQRPDISDERANTAAGMMEGTLAKGFTLTRGEPLVTMWVQRQTDWSYEQKRDAIRTYLHHVCRSNWLPAPKDEDLEW